MILRLGGSHIPIRQKGGGYPYFWHHLWHWGSIAGTAMARDLILVTANTDKFERVEGLRIENWRS